jgi:hypothetical protein
LIYAVIAAVEVELGRLHRCFHSGLWAGRCRIITLPEATPPP